MKTYINEGHAITVPYNKDYSIEAKIKSNGRNTNLYTITLLLVDIDTEESWIIEQNIKAEGEPKTIKSYVADSIEKLMIHDYFRDYIKRWERRKYIFEIGIEQMEKENV